MKIITIKQWSPEWHQLRIGKVTWTTLKDVMGASNLKLIDTMIAEHLSNEEKNFRPSEDMERGIDEEPRARKAYESLTWNKVTDDLFLISDEFDFLWHSPDWLIQNEKNVFVKGLEIKCPSSSKHIEYIRINRIPNEYKYQIINYFLVCETLEALDFVSYDPRILVKPLHIVTVTRRELESEIEKARTELIKFKSKFDKYYKQIAF